jgi:hypothetical protein
MTEIPPISGIPHAELLPLNFNHWLESEPKKYRGSKNAPCYDGEKSREFSHPETNKQKIIKCIKVYFGNDQIIKIT